MWMWAHQSPTRMMRFPAVTALTAVTASTLLQLPASHVSELLPSCLHPVPESPCSLRPLLSILGMCPFHIVSLIFGKPHCSNSIDWSDLFYLCCGLGCPEWVGCDGEQELSILLLPLRTCPEVQEIVTGAGVDIWFGHCGISRSLPIILIPQLSKGLNSETKAVRVLLVPFRAACSFSSGT